MNLTRDISAAANSSVTFGNDEGYAIFTVYFLSHLAYTRIVYVCRQSNSVKDVDKFCPVFTDC